MKKFLYFFLLLAIDGHSQYNSKSDTIIINTQKQIDKRPYLNSYANIPEYNRNCRKWIFPVHYKGITDTLTDTKIFVLVVDEEQAKYQTSYQSLKSGKIIFKEYDNSLRRVDTSRCHKEYINTYISVLTGFGHDSTLYYIPETNNNFDFSDEKAYILRDKLLTNGPLYIDSSHIVHKFTYQRFRNNNIVFDSTYIAIGKVPKDVVCRNKKIRDLYLHIDESKYGSFTYNDINYNLVIAPGSGSSVFYNQESRLYFYTDSPDFNSFNLPYFPLGEKVQLDKNYYRISKIDDNGEKVILVKL